MCVFEYLRVHVQVFTYAFNLLVSGTVASVIPLHYAPTESGAEL